MNLAFPMTLETGTVPDIGSPVHSSPLSASDGMLVQWARESAECVRLSPITHRRPCGTATGPNSLPRHGYTVGSAIMVAGLRNGCLSGLPLTVKPVSARHCTVCPPTAITRFTRSFSSGGTKPMNDAASCTHRSAGLLERIDLYPVFHDGGPLKTMTSPGCGVPKR